MFAVGMYSDPAVVAETTAPQRVVVSGSAGSAGRNVAP